MTQEFHHPTRAQRDQLAALSIKLTGVSSKWQKMLKETKIFVKYEEYGKSTREYKKAVQDHKALIASGENLEFQAPKRAIYRSPSYEELINSLIYFSDLEDYKKASPEDLAKKSAAEFLNKKLSVALALDVKNDEKVEFDELLKSVNAEFHEWIGKMVMAPAVQSQQSVAMVRVNGINFLKNIIEKQGEIVC